MSCNIEVPASRNGITIASDVVLETGSVLESDSSTYFEDSDSDSNPMDSVGLEVFRNWTQHCMTWN